MMGELAPSSKESSIHKRGYINIPKLFQLNLTSMSSNEILRDVEQISMNINVNGGLFHHLPSI